MARLLNTTLSISVTPSRQIHIDRIGDAILTCSVENNRQGDITWTLNGGLLPNDVSVHTTRTMSVLTISPVMESHKGLYTCTVHNSSEIGTANGIIEVIGRRI